MRLRSLSDRHYNFGDSTVQAFNFKRKALSEVVESQIRKGSTHDFIAKLAIEQLSFGVTDDKDVLMRHNG